MEIQNLIERKEDKLTGPMSPVSFMKSASEYMGENYNRLARVRFEKAHLHQIFETGEGFTSYDTLILGQKFANDFHLTMWVDMGTKMLPVAQVFENDMDLVVTPIYRQQEIHQLSDEEILEAFKEALQNPEFVEPPEAVTNET